MHSFMVLFKRKFSEDIQSFGLKMSKCDPVFHRQSLGGSIILVIYVDDIVITGSDYAGISSLKSFLHTKFHIKDLGHLKYFLRVEVSRSNKGIFHLRESIFLTWLQTLESW